MPSSKGSRDSSRLRSIAGTTPLLLVGVSVLALLLLSDVGGAADEELVIEWADDDHAREFERTSMHSFNFTIEYVGPRVGVQVKCMFDIIVPGLSMYPLSEEEMDVDHESFRYLPGRRYNGTFWAISSPHVLNGTHWVNLTFYIKDNYPVSHTYQFELIMRRFVDFDLGLLDPPPDGEFRVVPPSPVTVRFRLYNLGNGPDAFHVTYAFEEDHPQWEFARIEGVNSTGHTPVLSPDAEMSHPHYIDVVVVPEEGGFAMTTNHLRVVSRSMLDPSIERSAGPARLTTLQYYGFTVEVPVTHIELVRPKAQVEFIMDVHNTGNGLDTFKTTPAWDVEENPGFIAASVPDTVDIDPDGTGRVMFIIMIPDDALMKTYRFTAEVRSSSPGLSPWSVHLSVEVGQYYAVGMSAMTDERTTVNGGYVEFDVTVRNAGNGLDSIVLLKAQGLPASWLVYIQPSELTLLQGQEAIVKVLVVVPSQFQEAPVGTHTLTVPAKSSRGDARSEIDLDVVVGPHHKVAWIYDDNAPRESRRFNPYEQNWSVYLFEIKNVGNIRDDVGFEGSSSSPLVTVTLMPSWSTLDPWESRTVGARVEVPRDIPPGLYTFLVSARSVDSEEVTPVVILVEFEIYNLDVKVPPVPTSVDPSWDVPRARREVPFGSNLSFKLGVENNGTRPAHPVTVRVYDNFFRDGRKVRWNFFNLSIPPIAVDDRYVVGERPYTNANPPMYWWANVSGNHTLEFRVFLDHQSDTGNDVAYLEVLVGPGPSEGPGSSRMLAGSAGLVAASVMLVAVALVLLLGVRMKIRQIRYG